MNPLTRSRSAALRPHVVSFVALLLALLWAAPADAGRRSRKAKKPRSRDAQAHVQARERRAPPRRAPSSGVAIHDGSERGVVAPEPAASGAPARKAPAKEKVFDFSGLQLDGSVRMPQLLYFLDRAEEELERASLERRSFVPEMMRSIDEEKL